MQIGGKVTKKYQLLVANSQLFCTFPLYVQSFFDVSK